MDEYDRVCQCYNKLCTERNDPSFWAENILEATKDITQKIVWQNFYAYMANEEHKFTGKWQQSLGDLVDSGVSFKGKHDKVKFNTKTVQNGNVTYIRMTPDVEKLTPTIKDGEPLVGVLKKVQEISPGLESETGDEKCEF